VSLDLVKNSNLLRNETCLYDWFIASFIKPTGSVHPTLINSVKAANVLLRTIFVGGAKTNASWKK